MSQWHSLPCCGICAFSHVSIQTTLGDLTNHCRNTNHDSDTILIAHYNIPFLCLFILVLCNYHNFLQCYSQPTYHLSIAWKSPCQRMLKNTAEDCEFLFGYHIYVNETHDAIQCKKFNPETLWMDPTYCKLPLIYFGLIQVSAGHN